MLIKYEELFDIKRGSSIHIRKILSGTTLIMLEKNNVFSYHIVVNAV